MNGSYIHLLHLIAFGLVAATLVPGFILDRKLRVEQDWQRKMYIGGIMRVFGAFAPYNVALLLITGLGNIHNRYFGSQVFWYQETWLVIKISCFVVLAVNALFVAPKLMKNRMMLIKSMAEKNAKADDEKKLTRYNNKVVLFFLAQIILLLTVLILSVSGAGKHPGQF